MTRETDNFDKAESFYQTAKNNPKNYKKAHDWYIKTLEENPDHLEALYSLGWLYEYGQGVDKDINKAKEYYEKAGQKGHYNSFVQLVSIYNPRLKGADQWYTMGDNYYFGQNGKSKSYLKARACYEYSLELRAGHSESLFSLGWLYEHGEGVEKDINKAKEYYQKAAVLDHEEATNHFLLLDNPNLKTGGQWYELGDDYYKPRNGKKKNLKLAHACYQQSLNLDPENRFALYSLGWLYEHGEGVEENKNKAKEFYKKSARKGHFNSITQLVLLENHLLKTDDQWYELGEKYYNGSEVQKYIKARVCYEQAIKLNPNHKDSLYSLGWLYEHGQGLKIDLTKARQYYEKHGECKEHLKRVEKKIIEELVKNKNLNQVDEKNRTALHRAAQFKFLKLYATLKNLGADTSIKDGELKTPGNYLTKEEQAKVNVLQNLLITGKHYTTISTSAPEIIVSRIYCPDGLDREKTLETLNQLYEVEEIKPLFDLAKLAMVGKHKLSKRAEWTKEDYDSDEEVDPIDEQQLKIIIDPNKKTVENIVCYRDDGNGGSKAVGVYVPSAPTRNTVYVGGARAKIELTRATIIHELCHFIAREVFENGCLPYGREDEVNKKKFSQICQEMEKRKGKLHDIFKRVFNSDTYTEEKDYHSELIVRVPQLIVQDKNGLAYLQKNEPKLLSYYQDVFLEKVKSHIKDLNEKALRGWSPGFFTKQQNKGKFHLQTPDEDTLSDSCSPTPRGG